MIWLETDFQQDNVTVHAYHATQLNPVGERVWNSRSSFICRKPTNSYNGGVTYCAWESLGRDELG